MYKPMYSLVIWQCAYTCIYQQVLVMNSLRKPKRLTIRGDDEKEWMFLVKAGEDLRLDQRIEQVHVHVYEYAYIIQCNACFEAMFILSSYVRVPCFLPSCLV